jgi:hypothetical protein
VEPVRRAKALKQSVTGKAEGKSAFLVFFMGIDSPLSAGIPWVSGEKKPLTRTWEGAFILLDGCRTTFRKWRGRGSGKGGLCMKRCWESWLRESVFIYCVIYTLGTILNSILYLSQGVRDDPSGNWHELTRAVIVLIGVLAYELALHLPVKNLLWRAVLIYIPTMALALGFVWLNQFIEPLAQSAYRDIFVNYTALFVFISLVAIGRHRIKQGKAGKRE